MEQRQPSAWMWLAHETLQGLTLDRDENWMTWFWQAGCHCTDEEAIGQSVEAFRKEGIPPLIGPIPADVLGEIEAAVEEVDRGR